MKAEKQIIKAKKTEKKLAQISTNNAQVLSSPQHRISVARQTGRVVREENKLDKANHQQLNHDIKRSIENVGARSLDSKQSREQATEIYIAKKALQKTAELMRNYNRILREKFYKKIALYNTKIIDGIDKKVFDNSLKAGTSTLNVLFKEFMKNRMIDRFLEESVVNSLIEDSMILDQIIDHIIVNKVAEESYFNNYLYKKMISDHKVVNKHYIKQFDYMDIIRNFKKFSGFHDTDVGIINGEINLEIDWYIRRYLQRQIYYQDELLHMSKKYEKIKNFVKNMTQQIYGLENKELNMYFNYQNDIQKMANNLINEETSIYKNYWNYQYTEDKKVLKVGIVMADKLRKWHKEELLLPGWCMLSCAGTMCLPLMEIDAFEAHVNQYLEAQYDSAKAKFSSENLKTPKLKKL